MIQNGRWTTPHPAAPAVETYQYARMSPTLFVDRGGLYAEARRLPNRTIQEFWKCVRDLSTPPMGKLTPRQACVVCKLGRPAGRGPHLRIAGV